MVCGELAANCGCGGNRVDIPCAGFGSVRWRDGYENILFHDGFQVDIMTRRICG